MGDLLQSYEYYWQDYIGENGNEHISYQSCK